MTTKTSNWVTFERQFNHIIGLSANQIGQNRLVYSPNWIQAQSALIQFGLDAGLIVQVDDYGNVYLDAAGDDDTVIATGSHMDTVVDGGRFDGLYGVLGGLHAVTNLKEHLGTPKHTLRVISFSEEEGSRFPATFTGSKYYAKHQQITNLRDQQGFDFKEARQTAVSTLCQIPGVISRQPNMASRFTELHIEQGPRLADHHSQVGLVTGIVGQRRWTIQVEGQANHAGTTPMSERHDALQVSVELIAHLKVLAASLSPNLTFTVGQMFVSPNSANVIPGTVQFTVDARHIELATLDRFELLINSTLARTVKAPMTYQIDRWVSDAPVKLNQEMLQLNQKIAEKMKLISMTLASGAGHDSAIMSQVTPTAMIFVPSVNGISHSPAELTHQTDLMMGISLLTASLQAQAY